LLDGCPFLTHAEAIPMTSPQTQTSTKPSNVESRSRWADALCRSFQDNGYVVLPGIVDRSRLAALVDEMEVAFDHARRNGRLFRGGGTLSGHLNCFPGDASRFVYDDLREAGVIDLIQRLAGTPLRAPNIGANYNLPGSHPQNEHADGYAAHPFLIANVAAVDTDRSNGAMEILCGTHTRDLRYWEVMVARPRRARLLMKQGDVVFRTSALWHRGMPNHTSHARPMLAFTWEDGGSDLADPYDRHGGDITFLPNRYATTLSGRLRERVFIAAPRLASAARAIQSLLPSAQ
jgi:hypothetical protein